jgi:hypothetical protein
LPIVIPKYYSTVQRVENDSIYMIGGLSSSVGDEFNLLSSCYEIDANLDVKEKRPMKFGRHSPILALVRDRFVITIGGMIAKNKPTQIVSAFDSEANAWFDMKSLDTPRVNCSAVVLN